MKRGPLVTRSTSGPRASCFDGAFGSGGSKLVAAMRRCVPPCAAHMVEEELLHLGGAAPAYGNLRAVCKDQALGIQLRDCVDVYQVSLMGAQEAFAQKIETEIKGVHVHVIDLVSAVGVHTGLGCLAIQVFDTKA